MVKMVNFTLKRRSGADRGKPVILIDKKRKTIKNVIKQEVKKQIKTAAETKVGYFNVNAGVKNVAPLTYNLMGSAGFSNGTSGENSTYVGDSFDVIGIKLRFLVRGGGQFINQASFLQIAIISTPKYVNATNLARDDLLPSYGLLAYPPRFDSDKCTVHWKKSIKVIPQIDTIPGYACVDEYIKFEKRMTFQQDGTIGSYQLKDKNYYLVFFGDQFGTNPVQSQDVAGVVGQVDIYYKDM